MEKGYVPLLLALLVFPRVAEACSCARPRSACEAFWNYGAVFAGEVVEITDHDLKKDRTLPAARRVRFRVIEAFGGIDSGSAETEVFTETYSAACGYPFQSGQRYLVFAFEYPNGQRMVTLCSPTRSMGGLNGDLRYLRTLRAASPSSGRLRGRAMYFDRRPDGFRGPPSNPFGGATIVARSGTKTVEATSDQDGRFELVAPIGTYSLSVQVRDGLIGDSSIPIVYIRDPRSCGEVGVRVRPDGHITGRLVDERGAPVAHVGVAVSTETNPGRWAKSDRVVGRTDAEGRFDIGKLSPGRFGLGVLLPRVPGTTNGARLLTTVDATGRSTPVTATLAVGERADVGNVVVTGLPRLVTLSGTVVDHLDQPLGNVTVELLTQGKQSVEVDRVTTDAVGRFAFAVAEGRYRLVAHLFTFGFWGTREVLPDVAAPGHVVVTLFLQLFQRLEQQDRLGDLCRRAEERRPIAHQQGIVRPWIADQLFAPPPSTRSGAGRRQAVRRLLSSLGKLPRNDWHCRLKLVF